jgi:drug/metabolite transporter (DMT)-like permease
MTPIVAAPVEGRAASLSLSARLWSSAWLLLPFTALFWSGNAVVGRAVRGDVPPVALAFWRWSLATVLAAVLALPYLRRDWPALRRRWPLLIALGVLGIGAFNTMFYWGLQETTALNGVLMQAALPLIVVLWAMALYREAPSATQVAGALVSIAGVAFIVSGGALGALLALRINPGDTWVVGAIVLYGLYSALLRRRPNVHPFSLLFATFTIGALVLLPLYIWERASGLALRPGWPAWLAILYTALFPSCVAYLCFNRGAELIGPARAGQVVHLMPFFGALLAMVFLGERLHPFHLAGVALIAAGILLAQRGERWTRALWPASQ